MKKLDMNLLERYYLEQKIQQESGSPLRIFTIVLLSLIFILGAFSVKVYIDNKMLEGRIVELTAYLNQSSTQEKIAQVEKIQSRLDLLDQIETEATGLVEVMDYIPLLDSYLLDIVDDNKPSTTKIVSVSYLENTLNIEMNSKYASDFSNYVLHLVNSHSFESVTNYSYDYDETLGLYTGTLVCVLKGGQ